jgi:ankyrin repeat protein
MRVRPVVVRWSVAGVLAATTAPAATAPGTYWQERACSKDYRWCAEWVRLRGDGRLEVRCEWRGDRASKASDDGNRQIYLTDEAGRRYDHVATSGAAAFGAIGDVLQPGEVGGTFTFPGPAAGAQRFTLRDDANGLEIPAIVLDATRRSSIDASRALLGHLLSADAIDVRDRWNGMGRPRDRRVQLSRDADGGFSGVETTGERERARNPGTTTTERRTIRLTKEQARLFLETLVGSAAVGGTYRPRMTLDNYPHLEIEIRAAAGSSTFSTRSVGADHTPWALDTGGRTLVVPSSHPGRALRFLRSVADGKPAPELAEEPDEAPRPLRMAAQRGDVPEIERLLARGARLDERTPYDGETALTAAARWGQAAAVKVLVEKGADPGLPNAAGENAVVLAAEGGHTEVVKLLSGGPRERKALAAAASAGSEESLETLLAAGPATDAEGGEALYHAAARGSAEMVRSLLAAGAPVNDWKEYRGRPLDGALTHGHPETARLLIAAGADLAGGHHQWPALFTAASVGHADLVELCLRSGADVREVYAPDGRTALSLARVPAVAEALLRAGAHVNARRLDGATALLALTQHGGGSSYRSGYPRRVPPPQDVVGTARVLLDAGADLAVADAKGVTALHAALEGPLRDENVALAVLFLERGADANAPGPEGRTPLWIALEYYSKHDGLPGAETVKPLIPALVKAGARDRPNAAGETPLRFAARQKSSAKLLALLEGLAPRS